MVKNKANVIINKANFIKCIRSIRNICLVLLVYYIAFSQNVYADEFDNVVAEIAKWARRAGTLLAFYGGFTVAMAFSTEDAGGKRRGALELVSGLMVVGIAVGYKTIFNM